MIASEACDWQLDRVEAMTVERNRYFVALLVALLIIILQAILFIIILPLKQTKPYIIEIDRTQQMASILEPLDRNKMRHEPLLRHFFFSRYVEARMSQSEGLAGYYQTQVRAMSTNQVFTHYQAQLTYDSRYTINTKIITQSSPFEDTMEIRFVTEKINKATGKLTEKSYWLATIHYVYADANLPLHDREQYNPLGLFVTDFTTKLMNKESL